MKNLYTVLATLFVVPLSINGYSQAITSYNWEVDAITALNGVSAYSVSSSAVVEPGGSAGKGLNAGLPKQDVDLTFDGLYFNVDGIDVSVDFQRDENTGYFFSRGNSLRFGMTGGKLRVTFRVDDGNGGFNQIVQTNIYNVPNDDTFRNYRFMYDGLSGIAQVYVDNVVMWTYNGTPNTPMYWGGTGDMIIGDGLDGSGSDKVFLDNANVTGLSMALLPVELVHFTVKPTPDNNKVVLRWVTATEMNSDKFIVERTSDFNQIEQLGEVRASGSSSNLINYVFEDEAPYNGTSYYRLVQIDLDGTEEISFWKQVSIETIVENVSLLVYPNPANKTNQVRIESSGLLPKSDIRIDVYDLGGKLVFTTEEKSDRNGYLQYQFEKLNQESNTYVIYVSDGVHQIAKTLLVN